MKRHFGFPTAFSLSLLGFALNGCVVKSLSPEMGDSKWGLEITWHGQSCFTLRDSLDRTLVLDPFDETVGFGRLSLKADALLITHNHFDHNFKPAVKARHRDLELVESTGTSTVAAGLLVTGIPSSHDDEDGSIHGPNTIYSFTLGGVRCLHVGDLGQARLTPYQKKIIGVVDVLFVPVGGVTTINAERAWALVKDLRPAAVFPMHYGNIRFYPLDSLEKFTALFPEKSVRKVHDSRIRIREADREDEPVVYVLPSIDKNH